MMDPSCKEGSESEEMSSNSKYPDRALSEENQIKTCADCGTSKTPLWRGGPAGPKSLCNACGIRSRKKRRTIMGGSKEERKSKRRMMNNNGDDQSNGSGKKFGDNLKRRLMEMGRKMVMQRPRSTSMARSKQRSIRRKKMGEEEQAAILLMALSCGSVYA